MADSQVNLGVTADTSQATQQFDALNNRLLEAERQLAHTGTASQAMGQKLTAVGGTITSIGMGMTTAITLPILAMAGASIKLASDFSENVNKVDVIFGKNAEGVKSWAGGMVDNFGIAEGSALEMVSMFGDMGSSMGLSNDKSTVMSKKLVELAGDMASFKNIGIAEAQTALQGVFTGEGEALKSMGIAMTVANLEAYSLTQGSKKLYKEMSEAEKIQLRYNYILSVSGASQGDFARTSDGLANASRTVGERIKELGVMLGERLMPIITPIVVKFGAFLKGLAELSPATQDMILWIGVFLAVLGPLVVVVGVITVAIGMLLTAGLALTGWVALAVVGFVALVAGAVVLAKYLTASSIPAVDLFGNKTSEATKKAVTSYLDLDTQASASLKHLELSSEKVSKETADKLVKNFDDMGTQIKTGMDTHHKEMVAGMTKFFVDSDVLSTADEAKRIEKSNTANEAKKAQIDKYTKEEQTIVQTARDKNIELTQAEYTRLDELSALKKDSAITYLSATEVESTAIRQRIKDSAGTLQTEELATTIQNSIKNRDTQVQKAQETYDGKVASIIRMRDESGVITAEEADKMIAEAEKSRKGTTDKAKEMHATIVQEAKAQATEHIAEVDWETGEIKSKTAVFTEGVVQKAKDLGAGVKKWFKDKNADVKAQEEASFKLQSEQNAKAKENFDKTYKEVKKNVGKYFKDLGTDIKEKNAKRNEDSIKKNAEMKKNFDTNMTAIKTAVSSKLSELGNNFSTRMNNIKTAVSSKLTEMKTNFRNNIEGIKKYFSDGFGKIVSGITEKLASIKGKIATFKAAFKNLFSGVHIPKFSISGTMNPAKWAKEGMPKLHMNAKGGIFKNATLLGGNNVVGEAGAEAVVPLSNKSAVRPFAMAVASQFRALQPDNEVSESAGDTIVNVFNPVVKDDFDLSKLIKDVSDGIYKGQERTRRARGGSINV